MKKKLAALPYPAWRWEEGMLLPGKQQSFVRVQGNSCAKPYIGLWCGFSF